MLKWSDSPHGAGFAGATSTLTVGFIHILKNVDTDILDILEKLVIQHTEFLQICISTPLGSSHCGLSMKAETPDSFLVSTIVLGVSYLLLVKLVMCSEPTEMPSSQTAAGST